MPVDSRLCISVAEAAALLDLSRPVMYDLCRSESCTFVVRVGRRLLVSRAALEKWLQEQSGY